MESESGGKSSLLRYIFSGSLIRTIVLLIGFAACITLYTMLIGSGNQEISGADLSMLMKTGVDLELCRVEVERLKAKADSSSLAVSSSLEAGEVSRTAIEGSGELEGCREELKQTNEKLLEVTTSCQSSPPSAPLPDTSFNLDEMSVEQLKAELKDLRLAFDRVVSEKSNLEGQLASKVNPMEGETKTFSTEVLEHAKQLLASCNSQQPATTVTSAASADGTELQEWKGYRCKATPADLSRFLNYTPRARCPNDWYFVQKLIFVKDCFSLPKRRCLSLTPPAPEEPLPLPTSLFDQSALKDSNVRWDLHQCKSFQCLNERTVGDCRNCFNLSLESHRWQNRYRGAPTIDEVMEMKKGGLRLGLDAGGGTGSFAAHFSLRNVTVMTTAMNVETVYQRRNGLPYMEAIALRGLIPLHVPHKSRLPLFDSTLDFVHSVNSVKYLSLNDFEELVFEWDRVIRPGGIIWFEMFYAPVSEMPLYIEILELLGYKKLYWNLTPKPDAGEVEGEHVYLNCVIEKPRRELGVVMDGPPEEDWKLDYE